LKTAANSEQRLANGQTTKMLEWLSATTENGGEGRIASGEWSNDKNVGVAISHDRLSATTENGSD
jgi:hypothetical protein